MVFLRVRFGREISKRIETTWTCSSIFKSTLYPSICNRRFCLVVGSLILAFAVGRFSNRWFSFRAAPKSQAVISQSNDAYWRNRVELFSTTSNVADLVFVGDSLTAAGLWGEWLEEWRVVNRGISGETTDQLRERIDEIAEFSPATVFIMVGINDLANGATPERVARNYEFVISRLLGAGCRVVVQSTLFTSNEKASVRAPQIVTVNQQLKHFCSESEAEYFDLTAYLCRNHRLRSDLTTDGIHLNASGYIVWRDAVMEYLSTSHVTAENDL